MTQRITSQSSHVPPMAYFVISAIFHYLGPAIAVLLFNHIDVLGVAWLRIASAAAIFAVWRRPWRLFFGGTRQQQMILVALGVVLGLMNISFYLAISRLPLGTVGAIEFIGQIILAAIGVHTRRNLFALGLAIAGGAVLSNVQLGGQPLGFVFAIANCALFMLYVVLAHRIAQAGVAASIDGLGASMLIALLVISPITFNATLPAFSEGLLLLAGIAVGVCSSVIPYVTDQLAMAQLPRATFALMLSLLPAFAVVIGAVVLHQIPTVIEGLGIVLIMCSVAIHQPDHTLSQNATLQFEG